MKTPAKTDNKDKAIEDNAKALRKAGRKTPRRSAADKRFDAVLASLDAFYASINTA